MGDLLSTVQMLAFFAFSKQVRTFNPSFSLPQGKLFSLAHGITIWFVKVHCLFDPFSFVF